MKRSCVQYISKQTQQSFERERLLCKEGGETTRKDRLTSNHLQSTKIIYCKKVGRDNQSKVEVSSYSE